MVTIAEIAKELDIPATTAREYTSRFKEYFVKKETAGKRWPVYLDEARDVLKDIVEGYRKDLSTEEIRDELRTKYPVFVNDNNDTQQRTQNVNNESTTTSGAVTSPRSSLDIVAQLQVQQFQWLQRQSELMERQTELLERVVTLTEQLQARTEVKRSITPNRKKNASKRNTEPRKQAQKPVAKTNTKQKQNKGLLKRFFG